MSQTQRFASVDVSNDDLDDVIELQRKLKRYYGSLTLPRPFWFTTRQDLVLEPTFFNVELEERFRQLQLEAIFVPSETDAPKRVSIEGESSYGKTVLFHKIANDWSLDNSYVNNFRFVFLLSPREMQNGVVEDGITRIGEECGFESPGKVIKLVEKHLEETLIIFDGVDDEKVVNYLRAKRNNDVTILFAPFKGDGCEARKVNLKGINVNWDKFLGKFVTDKSKIDGLIANLRYLESLTGDILKSTVGVTDLVSFSLFNINYSFTVTNFYKYLINMYVRRSTERAGNELETNFDVFEFKNPFQLSLHQFGREHFPKILENSNYNISQICKTTFLTENSETKCEMIKKSLVQFASAFFVSQSELKISEITQQTLKKLISSKLETTNLFIQFFVGFLNDKACDFFILNKPYSYLFTKDQITLWKMLNEVEFSDKLVNSIQNFIPPFINRERDDKLAFYSSKTFKQILDKGMETNRIKYMKFNITKFPIIELPPQIPYPILHFYYTINNLPDTTSMGRLTTKNTIKCKKLIVELNSNTFNPQLTSYLTLFNTISAETRVLDIKAAPFLELLSNIKDIDIDHFECSLLEKSHVNYVSKLINLIKTKKLTSLTLTSDFFPHYTEMNNTLLPFLHHLESLELSANINWKVDIGKLNQNRQTQLKYLILKNIELFCDKSQGNIQPNCVYGLVIQGSTHINPNPPEVEVLSQLGPTLLCCNSNLFFAVCKTVGANWPGCKSVTQLTLEFVTEEKIGDDFWIWLRHFEKLEVLKLKFEHPVSVDFQDFLRCLGGLKLKKFVVWGCENDVNKFAFDFVDCFTREKCFGSIESVDFQWKGIVKQIRKDVVSVKELMSKLLLCLEERCGLRVGLIGSVFEYKNVLVDNIGSKFSVKSDVYGQEVDDPELDKWNYYKKLELRYNISVNVEN